MSAHSVPLHCPYCAGEDLHPHGDAARRLGVPRMPALPSRVKFIGLLSVPTDHPRARKAS